MSARDAWSPDQYERFKSERSQPFFDLLSWVEPRPHMRVVDLGCGTGELTRLLHERLHADDTLGVDNSERMLEQAHAHAGAGLHFALADIGTLDPPVDSDLIFSNAALHWVEDHRRLFARLAESLDEGGQLAVQMPANHNHPAYRLADEVAAEESYAAALGGYRRGAAVLEPGDYDELLTSLGMRRRLALAQTYTHVLDSTTDVVEWVRGALLTAYEKRMPSDAFHGFMARYRARIAEELGNDRPYIFHFRRILLWGRKGGTPPDAP